MNWGEFAAAAPDLAALGLARFDAYGLALIGTLRKDGFPRISPVEPYVVEPELLLGMMWESRKAMDLVRDPRLVVHSVTTNRDGAEGDFKLYGRARALDDEMWRGRYSDATHTRIDWRPPEQFHLFAVEIESAGFLIFAPEQYGLRWAPTTGLERFEIHE